MTERDREEALTRFNAMFDEAADETALLKQIGSPTMAAISVLRGYVPSRAPDPEPTDLVNEAETALDSENPVLATPESQIEGDVQTEPEAVPGAISDEPAPQSPSEQKPSAEVVEYFRDTPRPEAVSPEPSVTVSESVEEAPQEEYIPEEYPPEESPEPALAFDAYEAPAPKVIDWRLALYILFGVAICAPVTLVLIAVALAILLAGVALTAAGIFTISLAFVGITVFADVVLILGAGIVIASVGLPIIFCAVWFFIRAVAGFVNLILRKGGKWCYVHTEEVPKA